MVTPDGLFQSPCCSKTTFRFGVLFHRRLEQAVAVLLDEEAGAALDVDDVALVAEKLRELVGVQFAPRLEV